MKIELSCSGRKLTRILVKNTSADPCSWDRIRPECNQPDINTCDIWDSNLIELRPKGKKRPLNRAQKSQRVDDGYVG